MDGTPRDNDISKIVEADRAHIWHHLIQHKPFETNEPRIIVEGKDMRVWDQNGKEHIDGVSGGVWTVNVGYGRERIANAVRDQLLKLNYFAGAAGSVPGSIFAEKLIEKMPGLSRVYYCNSGSEANEKAFKMIRQIAHKRYGNPLQGPRLSRNNNFYSFSRGPRRKKRTIWPIYTRVYPCAALPRV